MRTKRGVGGGVSLAQDPREIRLDEVVGILEGSLNPLQCIDDPEMCVHSSSCAVRDLWRGVRQAAVQVLSSVTLRDLTESQRKKDRLGAVMYYI